MAVARYFFQPKVVTKLIFSFFKDENAVHKDVPLTIHVNRITCHYQVTL